MNKAVDSFIGIAIGLILVGIGLGVISCGIIVLAEVLQYVWGL